MLHGATAGTICVTNPPSVLHPSVWGLRRSGGVPAPGERASPTLGPLLLVHG